MSIAFRPSLYLLLNFQYPRSNPQHVSLVVPLLIILFSAATSSVAQAQTKTNKDGEKPQTFRKLTSAEYETEFTKLNGQGYIVDRATVKVVRNEPKFDVTFVKPKARGPYAAIHNATDQRYNEQSEKMYAGGLAETIHQTYEVAGKRLHIAIWRKPEPEPLVVGWKSEDDIPATGKTDPASAPLDQLFTSFLLEHQLPGATVAVAYRGKIIYERGFGYSDLESKTKMRRDAQMRIASVAKPLTGAAITQLVDRGKLKLTDKVSDVLDYIPIYPKSVTTKMIEPDFKKITILQLLHHTGGFDRNASYDPMFKSLTVAQAFKKPLPANQMDIIGFMMSQPLDFSPGEKMVYSNFGYCLLGRVIEKVSGQSYEEYVQKNIFKPVGGRNSQLGRSAENLRAKKEVKYYLRNQDYAKSVLGGTKLVKSQYGAWNQEALDSHGGWISTASDLVNFASAFDNPKACPLMREAAVMSIFSAPTYFELENKQRYYGFGWSIFKRDPEKKPNVFNAYHTGLLPGTSTLMVRRSDGFNWVVLFNCRDSANGKEVAGLVDSLMHSAVTASAKNAGLK